MNQIYEINECAGKILKTDETCNKTFYNSICTVTLHPFSSPPQASWKSLSYGGSWVATTP